MQDRAKQKTTLGLHTKSPLVTIRKEGENACVARVRPAKRRKLEGDLEIKGGGGGGVRLEAVEGTGGGPDVARDRASPGGRERLKAPPPPARCPQAIEGQQQAAS